MEHIETIELDSSQASITFSSIPQDYDDLVVLISARSDRTSASGDLIILTINGSPTNRSVFLGVETGGVLSNTQSEQFTRYFTTNGATADTFSNNEIYFSNYTSANAKSFSVDAVNENNATEAFRAIEAGSWNDTSAITSVSFAPSVGTNILTGSTISLYGVTAGGSGTVTTA